MRYLSERPWSVKRLSADNSSFRAGLDRNRARYEIDRMTPDRMTAPGLTDFEAMAAASLAGLPQEFRDRLGRLVVRVADFAAPEVLQDLGITDPFNLTGLYDGVSLPHQSATQSFSFPKVILVRVPRSMSWSQMSWFSASLADTRT